ncbi:ferrous iron transporter B [Actinomyces naeslundii]|uniref:Ferrous iron transporter B n=3 Tax=Actinomyces naeslundii TaxID=1655 RepID=A0AA47IPT8_ACTNA|nr:ferrous iron transporter B [Actinomyces naeslundii]OMG12307.1 ferrous iron transporter B [Actinomyces naeslundii]OMG16165.1 ferrous iron transporter B [Actinomyces naeslundii]OMG18552.1 ferrous iron transporter B [Actinomyces naeslundii]WAL43983.1 ferrous iron transporter B [Actinomyces naeslundii]
MSTRNTSQQATGQPPHNAHPYEGADCHGGSDSSKTLVAGSRRIALAGAPNAGKTSIYNALTGLHAKTGNYPGVTVQRSLGTCKIGNTTLTIEDLPGAYSLDPISPDEEIVHDVLTGTSTTVSAPDALVIVVDATTLQRGMNFIAEALALDLPTCLVVTMTDELSRRTGRLNVAALGHALGIPAVRVIGHRGIGMPDLRAQLAQVATWQRTPLPPPTDPDEITSWADSVLAAADYLPPESDQITSAIDKVLLRPVPGTIVFFTIMFLFFQAIFTWAAPFQDAVENGFGALGQLVHSWLDASHPLIAGLVGDGIIGGVGSVLTFIPQIIIMFLIIAVLEGVGYMSRAAFLMDKVMSVAGLEGRAFVALLSSLACAIPGIMATRTLPSTKDRVATMLAAPLMTCSARLPVYVIMISLTVDGGAKIGPFGARGVVMFALYLLGAVSAMAAAWAVKQLTDRGNILLPFYMEMPPYRMPRVRTVLIMVWDACKGFLKKAGTIITLTTVILWVLLNVPMRSDAQFEAFCASDTQCAAISAAVEKPESSTVKGDDGEVVTDPEELDKLLEAQKTSYTMDNSWAAKGGKVVQPVFEPLGFDWRINVATLSSLAARETFVATLGQIAAAEDPEEPTAHLATMTYQQDTLTNKAGDKLFNPATVVAILVFFVYALQCMATAGAMRRETGSWKWPIIAFVYMFVTAWVMAAITHAFVAFFI